MEALVILLIIGSALWVFFGRPQPHDHRLKNHSHPGVDHRLDKIESIIRIDRAAASAELEVLDEVMRHLDQRRSGGR